jgi:hypothetical protein
VNPTAAVRSAAEHLIRRACRRLPAGIRDECYREWTAETWAILSDPSVRPAARRHLAALRYAAGHVRGTRHHPHAQRQERLRVAVPTRQRLRAVTTTTAVAVCAVSALTGFAFMIPAVRSATGGLGDAFANVVAIAASFLVSVIFIIDRATRRRRSADDEPGQET